MRKVGFLPIRVQGTLMVATGPSGLLGVGSGSAACRLGLTPGLFLPRGSDFLLPSCVPGLTFGGARGTTIGAGCWVRLMQGGCPTDPAVALPCANIWKALPW